MSNPKNPYQKKTEVVKKGGGGRSQFLDALASLESMMSVIVSLTENNWVTDRKFSLLQDVM